MNVTKSVADSTFLAKIDQTGKVIKLRAPGKAGGEILGSIRQTNDGVSYITAGNGIAVASASNGQITLVKNIDFVPAKIEVSGTTETVIGALHVDRTTTYSGVKTLLGSNGVHDTARLFVKKFADSTLVFSLGTVTGTIVEQTTGSMTLTTGWHTVSLTNSSVSGSAFCYGLKIFM